MSKRAEMFKFTQLRPVNGIDYYAVQSKHFSLYENKPTELLRKIQKDGLPHAAKHALAHIDSASFKDKLATFEERSVSMDTKQDIYTLVSALQKIINHTQEYPLIKGKQDDLEILQYSRGMLAKYGLDGNEIKKMLTSIKIDVVSDDLYSLLLLSSYHTEYRRYIDTLYRFAFLVNTYTLGRIVGILSPNDTTLNEEDYAILKRFLSGRILLPNSVRTNKKPLPELDDNLNNKPANTVTDPIRETKAVKGISLSMLQQSIIKEPIKTVKPIKKVKKRAVKTKKLKAQPSIKKEARK